MENYEQIMQLLKDFFNPKFEDLVKTMSAYSTHNESQHDELYNKTNLIPVIMERNKNQQDQIDTLSKWLVGAFVSSFTALLGLTTALAIYLMTKK